LFSLGSYILSMIPSAADEVAMEDARLLSIVRRVAQLAGYLTSLPGQGVGGSRFMAEAVQSIARCIDCASEKICGN
jgi:hypothetical protein